MPTTDRDGLLVAGLRPRSESLQAESPKSPRPVGVQSWPETATPLVSICCITYNQVEYVRECIEGFLLQKTTFPIEILINDDASSDGTVDVIKEYEGRYPGVIKPIYQSENQYSKGRKPTIEFNLPRAKGKYVALCEGDDFWIDPLKLHKQVEILERRPEISICFHPVKLLERGRFREDDLTKVPGDHHDAIGFSPRKLYSYTVLRLPSTNRSVDR
jgi:glycosyltransferase involved in cell wall biosynthesis